MGYSHCLLLLLMLLLLLGLLDCLHQKRLLQREILLARSVQAQV